MNTKLEPARTTVASGDAVKYAIALLLVIAGVFAFYWFGQWPTGVRMLAVVAGLIAGALVFLTSVRGGQTREFLSEARFELRKVVWPTRQEATKTTWVVVAMVIVISLLLALFDVIIQAAVKWLLAV